MRWPVVEPSAAYVHGWHIDAIAAHLEAVPRGEITRLLINVPPGMTKSLMVGVLWPAGEWGPRRLPQHRYVGAAHSQDLAVRDNMRMRRLVKSEWYQALWPLPLAADQDAKLKVSVHPDGRALGLPNSYSDNAAETGQPAFPWRGRITCSPAAGYAGTVDKSGAAASQVAALFGAATPANFSISGESVAWSGPSGDWGLRRMILHYAHLCAAAGGVDAFLIGSKMRGLTTIRSGASTYPAVQAFRDLAADVRSILGAGTKLSYAADWSEYFGHQPGDGSGDVHFHLDPLWADANIDFIGIDNYMPLSDWRDGWEHADAQDWPAIYDRAYLQANIAGGDGFDRELRPAAVAARARSGRRGDARARRA